MSTLLRNNIFFKLLFIMNEYFSMYFCAQSEGSFSK